MFELTEAMVRDAVIDAGVTDPADIAEYTEVVWNTYLDRVDKTVDPRDQLSEWIEAAMELF